MRNTSAGTTHDDQAIGGPMTTRPSITHAHGVTRSSDVLPVYNVGTRCAWIGASIVLLIAALVVLILL